MEASRRHNPPVFDALNVFKTIIGGCRDCEDPWILQAAIDSCPWLISTVICGKARGVDSMGERWGRFHGLPVLEFRANWNLHGKQAGFIRNLEMADHAEALLAVWDGKSRGTGNMIAIARARKLPVHVHSIP